MSTVKFLLTKLTLALCVFSSSGNLAKAEQGLEVSLSSSEQFRMVSKDNGRIYRIMVSKPNLPPPEGGYPTIYVLDGNATFATAADAVRLQTRNPMGLAPAVVIAVGYETEQPFETTLRYFDYTSPAEISDLPKRKNGEAYPQIGGDAEFRQFLKNELIPNIEQRIVANSSCRTLVGHSLGGLFVLNSFLAEPETFTTYVAGSPSIWWNNEKILLTAETFVKTTKSDLNGKRLLIAVGGDEGRGMVDASIKMTEILQPLSAKGLKLTHVKFADEAHITVLPAILSRTVRFSLEP